MLRFLGFLSALFAGMIAFAACSGGGGGGGGGGTPPVQTEPPPVIVTQAFPSGVATAAGGGTAWDITGVKTTLYGQFHYASGNAYDTLRVDVTFAQDVSNALPAPGQSLSKPTQLGMSVAIDNGGNGFFTTCAGSKSDTPFEYASDEGDNPSRLPDGNYSILSSGGPIYSGPSNPAAEAQTTLAGHVISQTFFLDAVGASAGASVPKVKIDVAAINGTLTTATDCVPAGNGEISANGA